MLRHLPFFCFAFINSTLACEEKASDINNSLLGLKIEAFKSYQCDLVMVSGPAHMKGFPKLDKLVLVLKGRSNKGAPYFTTYINTVKAESGKQSGGVCVMKNDTIQLDIEASYTSTIGKPTCSPPSYTFKNIQDQALNL